MEAASLEHAVAHRLQQGAGLCPDMSHNLLGDEGCAPWAGFCLLSGMKGVLVKVAECDVLEHLKKGLVLPSQL